MRGVGVVFLVVLPLAAAGWLGLVAMGPAAGTGSGAPALPGAAWPQPPAGGGGAQALSPGQVAFVVCYVKPNPLPPGFNPGPFIVVRSAAEGTPCWAGGCSAGYGPFFDMAAARAWAARTTCP